MLESLGLQFGYQTDEMPAFYSRSSGIAIPRASNPEEIV